MPIEIVLYFVIMYLLLDLSLIGLIPRLLGIWRPINEIEDILFKDTVRFVYTDMTVKRFGLFAMGQKPDYLILTKDYFVVGVRRFSYINRFKTNSINKCSFEKQVISTKITLFLTVDGVNRYISFVTKYPEKWVDEFTKMGIVAGNSPVSQLNGHSQ